jgi:hypothetical protein
LLLEVQRPDDLGVELDAVEVGADEDKCPHEDVHDTSEVRDALENGVDLSAVLDDLITQEEVGTPHDVLFLYGIGLSQVSTGIDSPQIDRPDPWLVDQVIDVFEFLTTE